MGLRSHIESSKFTESIPAQNVIHLFEGGSALHGARVNTCASDLDICGVFIEPKRYIYGLDSFEHFVTSTSDESERNTSDDVDICLYSLRRWAFLACKGNPTALSYFDAIGEKSYYDWVWGYAVLGRMKGAIVAKSAATHYKGFVSGQMARLLGTKGQGKHGQRPELTENFGYDTKAAMHAVRLCGEGIELMTKGYVTYPRPEAGHLIDIRLGKFSLDGICSMVSGLLTELDEATAKSSLRSKPDRVTVNECLTEAYETFYEETKR
jgi:uncharacterized protein